MDREHQSPDPAEQAPQEVRTKEGIALTWPAVGTAARRLWPTKALDMTADAIVKVICSCRSANAYVRGRRKWEVMLTAGSGPDWFEIS